MGIFWSCCEDNEEVCHGCNRRGLPLTNNECQFCRHTRFATHVRSIEVDRVPSRTRTHRPHAKLARPKPAYVIPKKEPRRPLFGEFRCSCGRAWNSRRSWVQKGQTCIACHKKVYAHSQRELRPEDIHERSGEAGVLDHPEDLCQMCNELGYNCGQYKY